MKADAGYDAILAAICENIKTRWSAHAILTGRRALDLGRASLLAEDIEQKLRANRGERHVAEFVDDQQLECFEMLLQRPKAAPIDLAVRRTARAVSEPGSEKSASR